MTVQFAAEWLSRFAGIRSYWVKDITGGLGLSFNCNRVKRSYKGCGIGMVEHNDEQKRADLLRAAMYLTKADYWIELDFPEKGRTFRKGVSPKQKLTTNGKRIGRPRSKKPDVGVGSTSVVEDSASI